MSGGYKPFERLVLQAKMSRSPLGTGIGSPLPAVCIGHLDCGDNGVEFFDIGETHHEHLNSMPCNPQSCISKNEARDDCNVYNNMYNEVMRFTWDELKQRSNLKKHGLDFRDARKVFEGPTFTIPDIRFDYGEERFATLGLLDSGVVVIVHTETKNEIRIISMRKGTENEQEIFFENI